MWFHNIEEEEEDFICISHENTEGFTIELLSEKQILGGNDYGRIRIL